MLEFDPATRTLTLRDDSTSTAAACRHGGTSRLLAAMSTGRCPHTSTRTGDGRVLILGGDEAKDGAVEFVLLFE